MKHLCLSIVYGLCFSMWFGATWAAPATQDWNALLAQGTAYRQQGELQRSIDVLSQAQRLANTPVRKVKAAGELGATLLQAHRFDAASGLLRYAYAHLTGAQRADYALYLGNLSLVRKHPDEARKYFQEALALAAQDPDIRLGARLNLARMTPTDQRLALLQTISQDLIDLKPNPRLARFHLNLGNQARLLGAPGLALAYQHLEQSCQESGADVRLRVEALDTLAQLYEDHNRPQDALTLTQQGLALTHPLNNGVVADLIIALEWRMGRLLRAQGQATSALAAYQRAVDQMESVRQDIPVEYEDGRSSFKSLLEPVYLGYADLMLKQLDTQPAALRSQQLRQVKAAIELIRQTELQDFLGDRCSVEIVQGESSRHIPEHTAVLYPLILPDRVELLLETSAGIVRQSTPVNQAEVQQTARLFALMLRNGLPNFADASQKLYDWLLKPFESTLSQQHIQSLVVVPDGVLRLIPVGALFDGKQFAIEKYAVSMVTGMSLTNTTMPGQKNVVSLIAGISEPGPVVEKMGSLLAQQVLQPSANTTRGLARPQELRAINPELVAAASANRDARRIEELRKQLRLPGVKDEVNVLHGMLKSTRLLNAEFTVARFRSEAESGDYRIVHIASHGVFGGNAQSSFIMAYDDVLGMNDLQSVLYAEKFQKNPIELLSLSACETAEGNDRAPLGISGAAMKARAKSVLGTLWPVQDSAARSIMEKLYTGVSKNRLSKTESLRQAQLQLIHDPDLGHPFFWAPFVLIGNWL